MRALGWRQKHMVNYMLRNLHGDPSRQFSIRPDERKTAERLQARQIVRIVNKDCTCWVIMTGPKFPMPGRDEES